VLFVVDAAFLVLVLLTCYFVSLDGAGISRDVAA
jgi:hypothetical protein